MIYLYILDNWKDASAPADDMIAIFTEIIYTSFQKRQCSSWHYQILFARMTRRTAYEELITSSSLFFVSSIWQEDKMIRFSFDFVVSNDSNYCLLSLHCFLLSFLWLFFSWSIGPSPTSKFNFNTLQLPPRPKTKKKMTVVQNSAHFFFSSHSKAFHFNTIFTKFVNSNYKIRYTQQLKCFSLSTTQTALKCAW